ncbi:MULTISPECIES: CmpA/NrtA family ABC transporter substrate-binding protein [unclassified Erythrobacter]|uniref:CmpA/NrtA family ABC transporter substrate-binding protein n=1 Tax=unclassified Erythrobacter TaxID=2633097 RepID=UPI0007B8877C|nr:MULTISPECIES: CmpA/NrtA family ABC transporter substrate-binding protein [unclassified Erythrobacter]KZY94116.1 nitrate transporter [Erythrobacter sp. HI0074]KZZ09071.1 nitrate transporter [Erythrobacter sp. HI0077]
MSEHLTIGFLPLMDACLPILAQEHGFAREEGLELSFQRDKSWATVLDHLLYGHVDASHLLAPLAIATTLGLGRPAQPLSAPFALGLNGNAITVSNELAAQITTPGSLGDPAEIGARLKPIALARKAQGRPLRFAKTHRYSCHNYMQRYWLAGCGIRPDADVEMTVVPPPFMSDALAAGEIDGYCVADPWDSMAVDAGHGTIILATSQIWRRGTEKVLAVRRPHLEPKRDVFEALIRAMRKAAAHFVDPEAFRENAAILARDEYIGVDKAILLRSISEKLVLSNGKPPVHFSDFMFQHAEAANFPWISHAGWLYTQMVRWGQTQFADADYQAACAVFRPDIYRSALRETGDVLPGANSKVEGSLDRMIPVTTEQGEMVLSDNRFFDGHTFDPDRPRDYLSAFRF